MSFKRDGDDFSQLLILQKRQVSDLLVSHIPEDEALLIRNGKYACTVCSYRPIFDTLDMLAVHRKGKKHLQNLTYFLHQKKKDQEKFIERNPGQPLPRSIAKKPKILGQHHRLLKAKPYYSCMKRKPVINLASNNQQLEEKEATDTCSLPESTLDSSSVLTTYLKSLPEKRNFADVVEERRTSQNREKTSPSTNTQKNNTTVIDFKPPEYSLQDIEKKKECLKLLESGWKKDWRSGKWIRDESVEFDSDEEPPESLHTN